VHLVVTDSGLGGLAVCAAIERALAAAQTDMRLTYVNAWPAMGTGYNDLPDMAARARVLDRALDAMRAMRPDAILIACNTLSIVYEHTAFRVNGGVPVQGIVGGGVHLFLELLTRHPASALVLIGTRTTIDSGVHRTRLVQRGIAEERLGAASCHGLATAIERDPDSDATASLIDTCAARAATVAPPGDPLFVGLVCTHYGMVADRIAAALAAQTGRRVLPLDPNARLVEEVVTRAANSFGPPIAGAASGVEVISKVELPVEQREAVARLLEPISAMTASALREYRHMPDLF
jgi:glutamate racemase